jgi:mxaL protein
MAGRRTSVLCLLLAGVALSATFARPQMQLERPTFRYVFVFDISQSMNVADVAAANPAMTRLEYAKAVAQDAIAAMPCGTEVGLALFAGHRAFLMNTPIETCANYSELAAILGGIDWRMTWEARSEIAKGVFKSLELLTMLDSQTRLVFVTDGHEAPPLNPDVPPTFRGEVGAVSGLVVGVGGSELAQIPKYDAKGEHAGFWQAQDVLHVDTFRAERYAREGRQPVTGTEHLSALREDYLVDLAGSTGLLYHRLEGASGLAERMQDEALGIPTDVTADMRWVFALVALVTFVLMMLVPSLRERRRHFV